jgi:hypothetical protein
MHYDDAVRLCGRPLNEGSPVSIRQMLLDRFRGIQGARAGSFADRERAYLVAQGGKAGDSRANLWATHLGNTRPFTDGVKATSSLPAIVTQDFVRVPNDRYVGHVSAGGVYFKTAG